MDNYEKNYLSKRPEGLCKMCGLCCRVATTTVPYSTLQEMKEAGDKGATDFLSIFEPYSSIDEARKVSTVTVDNVIEMLKQDNNYNENDTTFYKCKYLLDNNTCSRYEDRLLLCKHFPASPWAILPPGCGYEGWQFLKREEEKQRIRKVKEELLELQLLKAKTKSSDLLLKISAVEAKMKVTIDMYKKYGSYDW